MQTLIVSSYYRLDNQSVLIVLLIICNIIKPVNCHQWLFKLMMKPMRGMGILIVLVINMDRTIMFRIHRSSYKTTIPVLKHNNHFSPIYSVNCRQWADVAPSPVAAADDLVCSRPLPRDPWPANDGFCHLGHHQEDDCKTLRSRRAKVTFDGALRARYPWQRGEQHTFLYECWAVIHAVRWITCIAKQWLHLSHSYRL